MAAAKLKRRKRGFFGGGGWSPRESAAAVLVLLLGFLSSSSVGEGGGGGGNGGCPEACTCKWKNGKQTVECVNASLSSIPDLEHGTQVLDMSHNYLPVLRKDIFIDIGLPNLQKIYLSDCSVASVDDHAFR